MNYKKIIKSRKARVWILSLLDWIPDRFMIPLQYRIHTGRKLNMKNPQRFTEKLQLYKLNYRNPLMLRCTDKYEVRKVVEEMGLKQILIPLIGVYDVASDVDFKTLPNEFVVKTTDGGGGNQVFVCKDKSKVAEADFNKMLKEWMSAPKAKNAGREWAYENGYPRRLIIEELISDGKSKDLPDYKFYCFNGEPYYCQLITDRRTEEKIEFYDMNWNRMPFTGLNPQAGTAERPAERPAEFEQLKAMARELARDFPFVRVDLYDNGQSVWFGEITFYPASGYGHFSPDEWDEKLGGLLQLSDAQLTNGGGKTFIINASDSGHYNPGLVDYKFFCFNGKVGFIYGVMDRRLGVGAEIGIYTPDWKRLDVSRKDEFPAKRTLPKPENFGLMIKTAESLSAQFPHVRIDLYNVNGKIYFGEFTFYDGSGYMEFTPDDFDFQAGGMFQTDSLRM